VQGSQFTGVTTNSNNNNSKVLIIALMCGGEPMARGVYQLFPMAQFVHYTDENSMTAKDTIFFLPGSFNP
jgi:hypothetical protein